MKAQTRWLVCALAVAVTAVLAASPAAAHASKLVFDDEFSGSSVSAPWATVTGQTFALSQCFVNDPQHVSESGGYLSLTATYEQSGGACGTNYESGAIQVPASVWSYRYGTAQARIEVPCQSGTGLWPSFWQYTSQNVASGLIHKTNGEIDTMELMDNTQPAPPNAPAGTVIQPGTLVSQSIHGTDLPLSASDISSTVYNPNWCGAFHVFGNTWTATSVTFTVDGQAYHTFNRSQFSSWPLTKPQAPVLSLLVGQFGGTPNPITFPQTMLVDWVRISSNG